MLIDIFFFLFLHIVYFQKFQFEIEIYGHPPSPLFCKRYLEILISLHQTKEKIVIES